jgi:hypothetical protein
MSLLIFLFGLISEQIASLRFERTGLKDNSPPEMASIENYSTPPAEVAHRE